MNYLNHYLFIILSIYKIYHSYIWRLIASVSHVWLRWYCMSLSLTTIPISCPKVRHYQQTNPLSLLACAQRVSVVRALSAQRQHREVVSKQWRAQCSQLACINVHRSLETNKCARCGVHAEQFRNVRAFLSTSHLHTVGRSVRSHTHKRARLSRTARAGLDRSHPLPATWGHTPRL